MKKIVEPYPFTDSSYVSTVDDGDTVTNPHAESGRGWANATGSGFQTDQRKAQGGTAAVATWTFNDLVPGKTYEIAATWNSASDTGATNAPFEVFQGAATGSAAWAGVTWRPLPCCA